LSTTFTSYTDDGKLWNNNKIVVMKDTPEVNTIYFEMVFVKYRDPKNANGKASKSKMGTA